MRVFPTFFLMLFTLALVGEGQERSAGKVLERKEKIRAILRIQDRRIIHDGRLIELLSDDDDVVRTRAALAYGSIQDTTVVALLVERFQNDKSQHVQEAAAYAIGQTAGFLSQQTRDLLQHDIIASRMERSLGAKRMIEELGKFGSEGGLRDLMLKYGGEANPSVRAALTMSIARFALRGITFPAASQYVVAHVISSRQITWQEMYALQRIGMKVEVRSEIAGIALHFRNPDPLVRMNLAILLGKIRDEETCLEPLQALAGSDTDWRVRVAALKALGNFHLTKLAKALGIFRQAMNEQNPYIATTALTALGNSDLDLSDSTKNVQEVRTNLERVAKNENGGTSWQVQGEAATALAKLAGPPALSLLEPKESQQRLLRAQLLNAAGMTGSPQASALLKNFLGSSDVLLYRGALEGLQELAKRNSRVKDIVNATTDAAIRALAMNDVAIVTTSASILGDSLFFRSSSVNVLLAKLDQLRIPDDIEAMQEIISALGKLKAKEAIETLEKKLSAPERSLVLAAASALKEITGRSYDSKVTLAFEPLYTDFDYDYLDALPDTVHVKMETIRGDVFMDFYKNVAPFTVMSVLKLATRQGFYRGSSFHRIVPTFVVQGGDPRGDGWGGPGYAIRSEFSPLTYDTGTLGIASAGKDTEGSQFFITQTPQPHLDGRYTIFGMVTSGMDVVNTIQVDDRIIDFTIQP